MALTENKKIAIWPTAKAAGRMLWAARKQHLVLSFVAIMPYLIIAAFNQNLVANPLFSFALNILWLFPLGILWQRLFLLGTNLFLKVSPGQFIEIWGQSIRFYLMLLLRYGIAAIIFFITMWGIEWLLPHALNITSPHAAIVIAMILTLAFSTISLILILHFMPTIVGITVEENTPPNKSWLMMKAHAIRLFLTIILLGSPMFFLFAVIWSILNFTALMITGTHLAVRPSSIETDILYILLSPLITAILVLPMAAMAIVYRDLVPRPEDLADLTA